MILTGEIQSKLRIISDKIRDDTASPEEYGEYERLLIQSGVSPTDVSANLKRAGFNSWNDFVLARHKSVSLKQKNDIQEAVVVGGLIALGIGVLIGLISSGKK
jgi:hypothetical protein